jgi:hypothetical protein
VKTPPADDDARYAELLASATDDETAGRYDAAALKLKLAQAHRQTPEVAERLARVARRGAPPPPPPVSSRSTPGTRLSPVPTPGPGRPRATPLPMLLLSVLRNQHLLLAAGFATRYPHPWLVWELGPRRPSTDAGERNTLVTQVPAQAGPAKTSGHDPLCFPLFGTALRIGRGDDCAIVIDDVTFSRDFGVLHFADTTWAFAPTTGGAPITLTPGMPLRHGDVTLTFETSTSFVARLSTPG